MRPGDPEANSAFGMGSVLSPKFFLGVGNCLIESQELGLGGEQEGIWAVKLGVAHYPTLWT